MTKTIKTNHSANTNPKTAVPEVLDLAYCRRHQTSPLKETALDAFYAAYTDYTTSVHPRYPICLRFLSAAGKTVAEVWGKSTFRRMTLSHKAAESLKEFTSFDISAHTVFKVNRDDKTEYEIPEELCLTDAEAKAIIDFLLQRANAPKEKPSKKAPKGEPKAPAKKANKGDSKRPVKKESKKASK